MPPFEGGCHAERNRFALEHWLQGYPIFEPLVLGVGLLLNYVLLTVYAWAVFSGGPRRRGVLAKS
jgi:hypothetical protein